MSAIHKRDAKGRIVKGGSVGGANQTSFKPLEERDPEKFAELVAMVAEDPEVTFVRLAEACGMDKATASAIVKRLNTKFLPVMEEARKLSSKELADKMESKLPMLIDAIDGKVPDATLRDVAVMIGVLTEKRQLLNGEPTQIMTYQERENLDKLGPELLKEMTRRGMVVDVSFQEVPTVQVHNPDVLPVEALSKTAQGMAKRESRAKNR